MTDTKMKTIGKLLKPILNKEIKNLPELDQVMKSINCKRITIDMDFNNFNTFNAGYNNGKYSFTVFVKDNQITNFTDL